MIDINKNWGRQISNDQVADGDDSFDIFLRSQLQQQKLYLNDDNFSVQVLAKLPKSKKISRWREQLIMLLPLVVITILVLTQNSLLAFAIRSWVLLSVISFESLIKITLEISILILVGVACWSAKKINLF